MWNDKKGLWYQIEEILAVKKNININYIESKCFFSTKEFKIWGRKYQEKTWSKSALTFAKLRVPSFFN